MYFPSLPPSPELAYILANSTIIIEFGKVYSPASSLVLDRGLHTVRHSLVGTVHPQSTCMKSKVTPSDSVVRLLKNV